MFLLCHGGPLDGRRLLAGDDRGVVTLADGRYVLDADRWVWEGRS